MLNPTMSNKSIDPRQHQSIVIGDILLHSESKTSVIQVLENSRPTTPSLIPEKPIINRISPNSSGTTGVNTIVACDLKNTAPVKEINERIKSSSSSKKKLMNVHKASMAFVKELKSKVSSSNHVELKSYTTNTNSEGQKTYF